MMNSRLWRISNRLYAGACFFRGVTEILYNSLCSNRISTKAEICAGAVLLGDISVGANSITRANAVVLEDAPENSITLGVPATIKRRKMS